MSKLVSQIMTKSLPTTLPEILAKQVKPLSFGWYRGIGTKSNTTPRKARNRGDEAKSAEKAYSVLRNNNTVIRGGAAANCTNSNTASYEPYDLASCMEERFRRVLVAFHEGRIRGAPERRAKAWHIR